MVKRKILRGGVSAVLALALTMSLAACGGGEGSSQTAEAPAGDVQEEAAASEEAGATQAAESAEVDPYGPVSEPVTLHIGRSEDTGVTYLDGQDSSNNYLVNHISEQLGVEFLCGERHL